MGFSCQWPPIRRAVQGCRRSSASSDSLSRIRPPASGARDVQRRRSLNWACSGPHQHQPHWLRNYVAGLSRSLAERAKYREDGSKKLDLLWLNFSRLCEATGLSRSRECPLDVRWILPSLSMSAGLTQWNEEDTRGWRASGRECPLECPLDASKCRVISERATASAALLQNTVTSARAASETTTSL